MAYTTTTLTTLQLRLTERTDGHIWWSPEESRRALNEALRVWQSLSGYFHDRITLTIPHHEAWLPIPGTLVQRVRLEINSKPISRDSLSSLRFWRPKWQSEYTGSGGDVPTAIKKWVPVGLSLVGIWPAPAVDTVVTVDGVSATPILVAPGDFVNLGDEEFSTLIGFALHLLAFKAPDTIFQGTFPYRDAFYKAAGERNSQFRASDFYARHFEGLDLERSEQPTHSPTAEQAAGVHG